MFGIFIIPVMVLWLGRSSMGAPLVQPEECISRNCTLDLQPVRVETLTAVFTTRAFNGDVPGPTIRVSPGETLRVTLHNRLIHRDNAEDVAMNNFRTPNTTNLHTHGLHVSSEAPADDIFIAVEPEESYEYVYHIPNFHMGGSHWYHPHHHGSTALQAGGGAAGLLIVEDAPDEVPPEVAGMDEVILFLTVIDLALLQDLQEDFNTALWQVQGTSEVIILTNGQTSPTLTIAPGTWYRFRMAYAAVETEATFSFSDAGNCEMQLLAKDGVYLHTAPREVTDLPLYPGARCDIAVRCSTTGSVDLVANTRRRRLQPGGGGGGGGGGGRGGGMNVQATGTALTLTITGTDGGQADLPSFVVNRPCYVADSQSATADETSTINLIPFTINNVEFASSTTYVDTFAAGNLVEISATGIAGHPLHIHVNPFQLITMAANDDTYFQVGDWHDTLFDGAGSATVRMYTDTFVGKMVVHCHVLEHEDQGMMGVLQITGTEGTVYADAETLDSSCFRGATGRGYSYPNNDAWGSPAPTVVPTRLPTVSPGPSSVPSSCPTPRPTTTFTPTQLPTTASPTTSRPTAGPTSVPTSAPTLTNVRSGASSDHHTHSALLLVSSLLTTWLLLHI